MSPTPPEQPDLSGHDGNIDRVDQIAENMKVNVCIEEHGVDNIVKEVNEKMTISCDPAIRHEGVADDLDDEAQIKVAAAAAKKAAMNKRKKLNNRKNKTAAKLKAAEDSTEKDLSNSNPVQSATDQRNMSNKEEDKLRIAEQRFREVCEQDRTDDLNAALRLISDGDRLATYFITKDQIFAKEVRTWEILGVDAWEGFEEDDVEDDPVTPGMPAFEVKTSSINGVGVFATRNIKKGTEIFREAYLLEGKTTTRSSLHLEAAVAALSDEKRVQVLSMKGHCACKKTPCTDTILMKAWATNGFKKVTGEDAGEYLYNIASRINHHCRPNSRRAFTKEVDIVFYATRGIRKGEEITHDYLGNIGPPDRRRQALKHHFDFICQCTACVGGVVLPASHVIGASTEQDETAKADTERTEVIGSRSAAEKLRIDTAHAWAERIHEKLEEVVLVLRRMIFLHAIASKSVPGDHPELAYMLSVRMKEALRRDNPMGLGDNVLNRYVDSLLPGVLTNLTEDYEHFRSI